MSMLRHDETFGLPAGSAVALRLWCRCLTGSSHRGLAGSCVPGIRSGDGVRHGESWATERCSASVEGTTPRQPRQRATPAINELGTSFLTGLIDVYGPSLKTWRSKDVR